MSVSAGTEFTCAINVLSNLKCWPHSSLMSIIPLKFKSNIKQVSGKCDHACAMNSNNLIACWGYDYCGETIVPKE